MRLPVKLFLPLVLVCLLAACSKLTVENYDRLKMGMSYAEVTALLGKPDQCSDVMVVRNCRWGSDKQFATVNFVADKAVLFNAEGLR